jgi:hypothetical protein
MTTKAEAIAALKKEYPTLRSGDDERGYEDLSPADYEAQIEVWADNQLANQATEAKAEQAVTDKAALLAKLGITADEAKLLLS